MSVNKKYAEAMKQAGVVTGWLPRASPYDCERCGGMPAIDVVMMADCHSRLCTECRRDWSLHALDSPGCREVHRAEAVLTAAQCGGLGQMTEELIGAASESVIRARQVAQLAALVWLAEKIERAELTLDLPEPPTRTPQGDDR